MTLEDALKTSIRFETKVRDHYLKGVAKITSPVGQRIFSTLAREEQGHVDYLQHNLDRLTAGGAAGAASTPESSIPPEWVRRARNRVARGPARGVAEKSDVDLVKLALELERETSSFYRELMEKLTPDDGEVFRPFLDVEDGHLDIVQAELDSLTGLGYWHDLMEFSLEAE